NEEQQEAVLHGEGPILVLAGAGSGKTRVITHRIAWLIGCRGVHPASIVALTFTNRAAGEMKSRVVRLVGEAAQQVSCSTFHSFAARLLRRLGGTAGRGAGFTIYDEDDQARLVRSLLFALGVAGSAPSPVPALISWIDRLKSSGRDPARSAPPGMLGSAMALELLARYETELRRADAFDFGDLIWRLVQALEQDADLTAWLRQRFLHLLVDEYQDTSPMQDRLIGLLAGPRGNLMVVGDDDQAIYGWRGASAENVLQFPERHPGCRVVRLEQNYRSRPPILEAANEIIGRSWLRLGKELRPVRQGGLPVEVLGFGDDRQEAEGVAELCRAHVEEGGSYGDVAVFFRAASLTRRVEEALLRASIPYAVLSGMRFYERAEVKDLLAWARFLQNPRDGVAARRAMVAPRRGIGEVTLERLAALVAEQELDWLEAARQLAAGKGRAAAGLASFVALAEELAPQAAAHPPAAVLARILERSGLYAALEAVDDAEARDRLANLRELVLAAAELELREPQARLADFLEQASLAGESDAAPREGRVSLLTLHAAKGLEFPRAIIIGLEEGNFPLGREDTDLEEERRLCYVGMTRAQEQLTLTWAMLRRRFQEVQVCEPSRFLAELPCSALARRLEPEPEPVVAHGGLGRATRLPPGTSGREEQQARAGRRSRPADRWAGGKHEPEEASFPDYESGDLGWSQEEEPPQPLGCRVWHDGFGEGEVVEVHGRGPKSTVSVRFPFRGVKRVQLRFLRQPDQE
ncbi:MAG: hypothetical protein FJ125_09955, partial [Deltaproteobacteria bacterium]|nr:hypothetical protein [Deltaproteobacteria bacterium]